MTQRSRKCPEKESRVLSAASPCRKRETDTEKLSEANGNDGPFPLLVRVSPVAPRERENYRDLSRGGTPFSNLLSPGHVHAGQVDGKTTESFHGTGGTKEQLVTVSPCLCCHWCAVAADGSVTRDTYAFLKLAGFLIGEMLHAIHG